MDDIKWARGEFAAIKRYKYSTQRLAKCDEMLANTTYKFYLRGLVKCQSS